MGQEKRDFSYEDFLRGEINVEMGIMVRSSLFLEKPKLRLSDCSVPDALWFDWARVPLVRLWL
jgi:hypothetical protein